MVTIGIDAFRLISEPRTSGAVYIYELVSAWMNSAAVGSILLYVPRSPGSEFEYQELMNCPKVKWVSPDTPCFPERNFRSQLYWTQGVLPRLVRRHAHVQYLIAAYHNTPIMIPRTTKVVTVVHDLCGLQNPWTKKAVYRHLLMFLTASLRTDSVVCISEFTRHRLARLMPWLARRVVGTVYNGVDSKTLSEKEAEPTLERLGLHSGTYFFWIGALSARKGFDVLLKAHRLYTDRGGRAELVVVVNRAAAAQAHAMAAEVGSPNTRIISGVSSQERDSLYRGAIAMLFPSQCEGFGYPIVEAMRQGCPPIAWKNGPAEEIVTGLVPLLNSLDPAEVSHLMGAFENLDTEERTVLSEQLIGRSHAFSRAQFGIAFLDLLCEGVVREGAL